MKADRVVLATGAATGLLERIAGYDIPQRSTPGVIAVTRPLPRLLNRIVVAPGIHMHQRDDGRVVLGEQDGAPGNEAHDMRLKGRPNDFPSAAIAQAHGERMLAVARTFCPGLAGAQIEAAYIGWRPLPVDGHPVIGAHPASPDIYVAVMHSGVSLAPIVGQLAAHEIANDLVVERLELYRPDRAFETVTRY
jgi:glycine/D-amino acid oxidase-like deaminating enzyme